VVWVCAGLPDGCWACVRAQAPTILDFFGLPVPPDAGGSTLTRRMLDDTPARPVAIYGVHGGQVSACLVLRYLTVGIDCTSAAAATAAAAAAAATQQFVQSRRPLLTVRVVPQVNCTDGRYVYMRGPLWGGGNTPLNEYTLMPTHLNALFSVDELQEWEKDDGYLSLLPLPIRSSSSCCSTADVHCLALSAMQTL
jgi:hypothetical protein